MYFLLLQAVLVEGALVPLQDSLHGTGMRWQLGGSSRGILRPANWKPSILTACGHDSSAPLTKVWAGWHYNIFP